MRSTSLPSSHYTPRLTNLHDTRRAPLADTKALRFSKAGVVPTSASWRFPRTCWRRVTIRGRDVRAAKQ